MRRGFVLLFRYRVDNRTTAFIDMMGRRSELKLSLDPIWKEENHDKF